MTTLYTIGHSNHSLKEFLEILHAHDIKHIVDIRSIPKSRFVSWSNQNVLKTFLKKEHIAYTYMNILGGRRRTQPDSINMGWHNASFRGFADYTQTPEFYKGLKELNQLLKQSNALAIMCVEAVLSRCLILRILP